MAKFFKSLLNCADKNITTYKEANKTYFVVSNSGFSVTTEGINLALTYQLRAKKKFAI